MRLEANPLAHEWGFAAANSHSDGDLAALFVNALFNTSLAIDLASLLISALSFAVFLPSRLVALVKLLAEM